MSQSKVIAEGSVIITAHPYLQVGYIVARVKKIGKVMWEIEPINHRGEFEPARRAKVTNPLLVPPGRDPFEVRERIIDAMDAYRKAVRDAEHALQYAVQSLVSVNV